MRVRVGKRQLGFAAVTAAGAVLVAGLCYALSPDVRVGWVRVLARVGADDRLAGMVLDSDKDVRAAATAALVGRGDRAVPALAGRLARPDPTDRATSCRVLGEIGPPARDALTPLGRLARDDPDPAVRGQAILAFARIGREDPRVAPALAHMLAAPAADDREAAAFACRMLGADAKGAIPALIDVLATRTRRSARRR